ncbi:hypothetical protein BDW22DRAFT_1352450 [Trametopsis cervina]|nr:hypothetical protein BDW22DRAFT_1352450 [Trametopsis cervina]
MAVQCTTSEPRNCNVIKRQGKELQSLLLLLLLLHTAARPPSSPHKEPANGPKNKENNSMAADISRAGRASDE